MVIGQILRTDQGIEFEPTEGMKKKYGDKIGDFSVVCLFCAAANSIVNDSTLDSDFLKSKYAKYVGRAFYDIVVKKLRTRSASDVFDRLGFMESNVGCFCDERNSKESPKKSEQKEQSKKDSTSASEPRTLKFELRNVTTPEECKKAFEDIMNDYWNNK